MEDYGRLWVIHGPMEVTISGECRIRKNDKIETLFQIYRLYCKKNSTSLCPDTLSIVNICAFVHRVFGKNSDRKYRSKNYTYEREECC